MTTETLTAELLHAQHRLAEAKRGLAALYASGAVTIHQRRVVGELGAELERLRRFEVPVSVHSAQAARA